MSLAVGVTDQLGLPPAPSIFAGVEWGSSTDFALTPIYLDLPAPPTGPPPDPGRVFCPDGSELYPYQDDGVKFLLEHDVALLGDEMGLGKSIQAIAALRMLLHRGDVTKALILCPKSVVFDWYCKLRQWAPDIRCVPVEGPKRRREWYWRCKVQVHLIGYETWREDLKWQLADPAVYDLVILDEIQRIKNPDTATHRAISLLQPRRRWGLSGTPLENRLDELVAIFSYLKPKLLPDTAKALPVRQVQEAIRPYVLRRCKVDVLQHLPPKHVNDPVMLELTPVQRMAYDAKKRELRQRFAADPDSLSVLDVVVLTQYCNLDPATGSSCKMDFLERELARLLEKNEKVLIFSQFPEKTLKPLAPRLAKFRAALFDGSLSEWNRQLLVAHFQAKDDPAVLAVSLRCGGTGITLTRANHVYHLDSWWNRAVANQAEDRTHRIGQKKPVYVTTLLTSGTIEPKLYQLVQSKDRLFRQVMDPLKNMEAAEEPAAIPKKLSRDVIANLLDDD